MKPWQLDRNHSSIGFSVRHLMVSTVRGSFLDYEMDVDFDPDHPELGSVVATVVAKSIDTGNAQRNAHLCSPDFLDADQFPTLTFRSTAIKPGGGDAYALTGDLTMHGITRPVTFAAEYYGEVANPQGGRSAGLSAKGRIRRREWGLTWNVGLEAGGVMVGDEVSVDVEIELSRPATVEETPVPVAAGAA